MSVWGTVYWVDLPERDWTGREVAGTEAQFVEIAVTTMSPFIRVDVQNALLTPREAIAFAVQLIAEATIVQARLDRDAEEERNRQRRVI